MRNSFIDRPRSFGKSATVKRGRDVTLPPKKLRRESSRMSCPHCGASCINRTSMQMSTLCRMNIYCCTNHECGHTFKAHIEIVCTISPSATPNPSVNLPLSRHVNRSMLRAVIDLAPEGEYNAANAKPTTLDLFSSD